MGTGNVAARRVAPDSEWTITVMITINKMATAGHRFEHDCLQGSIDQTVQVRAGGFVLGDATLKAYQVIDEGREILITLDVELASIAKQDQQRVRDMFPTT